MYEYINACADKLVGFLAEPGASRIEAESSGHVEDYAWLMKRLRDVNVSENTEFQRRYKHFWAMNVARLDGAYLNEYFSYLEASKNAGRTTSGAVDVAKHLYGFQTGKSGRQSLQFSFASKLVHMIDPTRPVYDRLVERFYFLPEPKGSGLGRLEELNESYEFFKREHARILKLGLLDPAIAVFERRFSNLAITMTKEKIIDSLIWGYVSWLAKGAVRDGSITYC